MTDDHNSSPPASDGDARALTLLAAALTEDGELLPSDEAEVAFAESQGVEQVELPNSLEQWTPRANANQNGGAEATDLAAYRDKRAGAGSAGRAAQAGWLSHGLAAVLGAAAAAALVFNFGSPTPRPTSPSSEPLGVSSVRRSQPIDIRLADSCQDCCAGSNCENAKPDLKSCSSGRSCVPCDISTIAKSHYRVRTGAVFTAEVGDRTIQQYPQGELELCARAGASREVCLPTHLNDRDYRDLSRLPLLASGQDVGTVLALRLPWKGVSGPNATPARVRLPLKLTPTSLCRGHLVSFRTEGDEVFATMSLFFDDTHYVELGRAPALASLREMHGRLTFVGVKAQLQETRSTGGERFALTVGPLSLPLAERVRWQLLEQNLPATMTVGADYLGKPLKLP